MKFGAKKNPTVLAGPGVTFRAKFHSKSLYSAVLKKRLWESRSTPTLVFFVFDHRQQFRLMQQRLYEVVNDYFILCKNGDRFYIFKTKKAFFNVIKIVQNKKTLKNLFFVIENIF
jgi:hypothetical protein